VKRRALVGLGLLGLLGAACGQYTNAHPPQPVAVTAVGASVTGGTTPGRVQGVLSIQTKDVGGAKEHAFTGNSHEAGQTHGRSLAPQTVTPVNPKGVLQLVIHPAVLNPAGPLYVCPVQGRFSVGDDFGAPRYAGGFHPHAGNDIFSDEGTPIVAPFDGIAENAANALGGNAVIVRGAEGYVYNAHLSAYGKLGPVHMGEIIGYVGNTGDALGTSPHDHFEWHPYGGAAINWIGPYGDLYIDSGTTPAVDPFPYLRDACSV
jgi:murein DD-endopeptidase MepM/ murein hydrolase activator NlpD